MNLKKRNISRSLGELEMGLLRSDSNEKNTHSTPVSRVREIRNEFQVSRTSDTYHNSNENNAHQIHYFNEIKSTETMPLFQKEFAFDRKKRNAIRRHFRPPLRRATAIQFSMETLNSIKDFEYLRQKWKEEKLETKFDNNDSPLNTQSATTTHEARPLKIHVSKFKKNCDEKNEEMNIKSHSPLTPNLSWSPESEFKTQHSCRPKSLNSQVPKTSKVPRSLKVRKWIEKRTPKDLLKGKEESEARCSSTMTPLFKKQKSSKEERGYETKNSEDAVGISFLSWSKDHRDQRINSLKDKLNSKGQQLEILTALEDHNYSNVLKIIENRHSRVQVDVCLLWACIQQNYKLAKLFHSHGANRHARDANGYSALHLASESGSLDIVKFLLMDDAKVKGPAFWDNLRELTPLMLAAKHGHADVIKVLLHYGANVDAGIEIKLNTALHYAVYSGNAECVKVLIDAGAIINPLLIYSETPLHIAVQEGNVEITEMLLKAGADVHASRGSTKSTCLHLSAKGSYCRISQMLLKAGADPNQVDSHGKTPLHLATRSQCVDSVQILLNNKADPNVIDNEGKTPLHTGIFKGSRNFECLKLLLESKANINISDNAGYTPLHLAALNDSTYCVKLFLKRGADLTRTTKGGVTALNIIARRTPSVITAIHEGLNNAINFVELDNNNLEYDGQIQLDFRMLMCSEGGTPECRLMSCFIEEGQKRLLKHPLCETFLYLKWLRVRSFFVVNVIFYAIFVFGLTQYFYLIFNGTSEYHHNEPNKTYLHYMLYMVQEMSENGTKTTENGTDTYHMWLQTLFENKCMSLSPYYPRIRATLLYIVWNMLSFLMIKEGFQSLDSPRFYLTSFDNVLVWPVITGSFAITIYSHYTQMVCPWEFHTAALVVLFSWMQLLILIGRFPLFGLYVHMFAQVTKNFGKFLFAYICLIHAFSLSFGILFHNQPPFQHRFIRLLKTLVMMTGEIDYNEWFYESKPEERILYKGTSHLIFAIFLVFGTIILMNLLVGLAVSDIQGLQKSAGLDRLVRQTQLIAHFESFMFSRWLRFLIPKKLLKFILNRILLLNSVYGNIFILNSKTGSSTFLPRDVTESIKRIARNRDHLSRRRNLFTEFRTLSSTFQPSGDIEGDVSRGVEAIRCGLDVVVWEIEDIRKEIVKVKDKINELNDKLKTENKLSGEKKESKYR